MRRSVVRPLVLGLLLSACYRLPLTIRENDASGYDDLGVPTIEAIEYTPSGRDVRVHLEQPGYVTVVVLDPARGASVRFKRGELTSRFAERGVTRFPLDRLVSPLLASAAGASFSPRDTAPRSTMLSGRRGFQGAVDRARRVRETSVPGLAVLEEELASRQLSGMGGPVRESHVLVIVSEHALDLVQVGMRLARSTLDPALTAQQVVEPTEGGRWIAAVALLRGQ
jgi:hypothetical protein